jgi:serine acetyltransferase
MAEALNATMETVPERHEGMFSGLVNRVCQGLARGAPGAGSLRVWLHRWRGVKIGKGSWIGYDCVLDTGFPELITMGDRVTLSIRVTIVAHFGDTSGVTLEDDVFVGPCAVILPGVSIGKGSVITAGTVVNRSVPAWTVVQGNPGRFIATIETPLTNKTSMQQFMRGFKPTKMK